MLSARYSMITRTRAERRSLPLRENEQHRYKIAAIAHKQVLQRTRKSLTKISCSHVNAGQASDENNATNGAMTDTVSSSPIGDPHSTCIYSKSKDKSTTLLLCVTQRADGGCTYTSYICVVLDRGTQLLCAPYHIAVEQEAKTFALKTTSIAVYCSNKRAPPTPQQKRFKVNARVQACIITTVS